jgi:carbon storage regulator
MLVLTRKSGQAIRIGEVVTITIVQLSRGRVRIGINAPHTTSVHRGEIYERIQAAQQALLPTSTPRAAVER